MTASLDLIVVPQVCLNPKKAKKNLKKASSSGPVAASQLPVDMTASSSPIVVASKNVRCCVQHESRSSTKAGKTSQKKSIASDHVLNREGPPQAVATPLVPQLMVQLGSKRSWFDVTEEDDDSFFGNLRLQPKCDVSPMANVGAAWVGLPADTWVHIFLFTDVAAVGRSASVCLSFRDNVWNDQSFWASYGGPFFAAPATAALARKHFQQWVYGFEGAWAAAFESKASKLHYADMFADAVYMLSGLTAETEKDPQLQIFIASLTTMLATFDASCPKSLSRAQETVARSFNRAKFLPWGAARKMQLALDQSVQRAQAECDQNTFWVPAAESQMGDKRIKASARTTTTPGSAAGTSVAMGALAVLGARHRGLNVAAAQRSLASRAASSA